MYLVGTRYPVESSPQAIPMSAHKICSGVNVIKIIFQLLSLLGSFRFADSNI